LQRLAAAARENQQMPLADPVPPDRSSGLDDELQTGRFADGGRDRIDGVARERGAEQLAGDV